MHVPKLRFKGYDDRWTSQELKNIISVFSGGTPNSKNRRYYMGEIPFIRSGEIHQDHTELSITEEALNNSSAKIIEKGDLLYAMYGATSGETSISKIRGAINQAILCIRTTQSKEFLHQWFLFNKEKILRTYLQGGQGNLSASIIKSLQVFLPSLDEQKKIGVFLSSLDRRIELQQAKVKALKAQKKGLLQKIFSQEVRFRAENEEDYPDWSYTKLASVINNVPSKNHQIYSSEIMQSGKYIVIDQGTEKIAGYTNDERKLFNDLPIIIFGDHTTELKYSNQPFVVGADGVKLLKTKDKNINSLYLFYALQHFNVKSEGYKRHFSVLKNVELPVPCLTEQNKISGFFAKLESKIEEEENKLSQLALQKKSLMQRMFV